MDVVKVAELRQMARKKDIQPKPALSYIYVYLE